jgi:type II secretory ATPase GspE/PulE/Tfp pilus assembly ATPase PilB-like protein
MAFASVALVDAGPYINAYKVGGCLAVLFVWARLLTWADKDAVRAHLPRELMNVANFGGLVAGFILVLLIPDYTVALCVLIGLMLAEVGTYLGMRYRTIGLEDLKTEFMNSFARLGGKAKEEKKEVVSAEGQLVLFDKTGSLPIPDAESPDRRPYETVQEALLGPMERGMERLDVTAGEQAQVTYTVDGVSYESTPIERMSAAAAIAYLKKAAGMDLAEKRKPQTGWLKASFDGKKREFQIRTAGSSAGESMTLVTDPKKRLDIPLENMGFSEAQLEKLREVITDGSGLVIAAMPKGQGLTTLLYGIIRTHDAFLSHIVSLERAPEVDLEGITQNKLPESAGGAEEAKQISVVIGQDPDVLVAASVEDPRSAVALAKFAATGKRVYVGLRAGGTLDAIRAWRKLVGDDALAMKPLKLVISGRLIRRLCSACKIGYTPDPNQLKKMNMNPETVSKLFQARTAQMVDSKGKSIPCNFCNDLAYKGRVGAYEMFLIDDEVRQLITSGGSEAQLKAVFRKQKGRYIQELALSLVEQGETSVQEVLRAMKADAAAAPAGSTTPTRSAAAPPSRPPARARPAE